MKFVFIPLELLAFPNNQNEKVGALCFLLCICFTALCDWLEMFASFSQPIMERQSQSKPDHKLVAHIFPLGAGEMFWPRILIGSMYCLRLL